MFGGPILHDNPRTGALAAPETRCAAQALGVTLAVRSPESEDFVWQAAAEVLAQNKSNNHHRNSGFSH